MPDELLSSVVVPVAEADDARTTARGLRSRLAADAEVLVVHVVEKAEGALDKASVEQRERDALAAFDAFREVLDDGRVETEIRYAPDVAQSVFDAAADADATAIAFTPRSGSRWVRLLTGDVALDLITETDRPVLVLPDASEEQDS